MVFSFGLRWKARSRMAFVPIPITNKIPRMAKLMSKTNSSFLSRFLASSKIGVEATAADEMFILHPRQLAEKIKVNKQTLSLDEKNEGKKCIPLHSICRSS